MINYKLLLTAFSLLIGTVLLAQNDITFTYTYDASGNRETRAILRLKSYDNLVDSTSIDEPIVEEKTSQEDSKNSSYLTDLNDYTINIYPNPTKNLVYIEISGMESNHPINYEIISTNGKSVNKGMLDNSVNQLNLKHLLPGTYLLQLRSNNTTKEVKIIKQ